MTRDYSDEVYNRLLKQIREINNETICPVTDALGDLTLHLGKWTGIIKSDSTAKYQKRMLDMNNTTEGQLKKIFKEVKSLDVSYSGKIESMNDRLKNYNWKIKMLAEQIHPGVSMKSADEIKKIFEKVNKELAKADKGIIKEYKAELQYAESGIALKALKSTVGGVVGMGVNIASMPAKWIAAFATGGVTKMGKQAAFDTWDLINSFFSCASGLSSLGALGVNQVVKIVPGTNQSMQEYVIEEAEAYSDIDGLSDALTKEFGENKVTKGFEKVSAAIDTAKTVDSIITHKDDYKNGDAFLPKSFKEEHKVLRKKDMLDPTGYKHMQYLYNKFEKQKITAAYVSHVYDYAEALFDYNEPDGIQKAITDRATEEVRVVKDAKKITKNVKKIIEN